VAGFIREVFVFALSVALFLGLFISAANYYEETRTACFAFVVVSIVSGNIRWLWKLATGCIKLFSIYLAIVFAVTLLEGGSYASLSFEEFIEGYRAQYWVRNIERFFGY